MKLALSLIVLVFFAAGCAHTLRLKTIDADTGQPLAGVSTVWEEHMNDLFRGPRHYGPVEIPLSGPDGVIEVRLVHPDWFNQITLTRPLYTTIYATYDHGQIVLWKEIERRPQRGFFCMGPLGSVTRTNGYFIIPMKK